MYYKNPDIMNESLAVPFCYNSCVTSTTPFLHDMQQNNCHLRPAPIPMYVSDDQISSITYPLGLHQLQPTDPITHTNLLTTIILHAFHHATQHLLRATKMYKHCNNPTPSDCDMQHKKSKIKNKWC